MKALVKYLIFRYSIFMSDIETVTSNLKAEIARRGLSVLELAGCLGISDSALHARLNKMKPEIKISELQTLARYMGISSELFYQGVGQWSKEGK